MEPKYGDAHIWRVVYPYLENISLFGNDVMALLRT